MKHTWLLGVLFLAAACGNDPKNMSLAKGIPGDLYIIMDSAQQKGPVGKVLDSILSAEMPGLPREEPIFRLHWVDARRLNYLLKERRNIIYVMTLDRNSQGATTVRRMFTPESITMIRNDENLFMHTASDVSARGQEVAFVYNKTEPKLVSLLRKEGKRLVTYFNQKERYRLTKSLFKAGQVKGISDILTKEYGCSIKVPFGFKLADKAPDFLWIRQINPKDDRDIFITRKPYTTLKDFERDRLISFRDEVCKKYLFADPDDTDSYLVTETTVPYIPVTADTVNFNGRFAIQLRGLFRSHTPGLGGPFLGYALVDERTQQLYYIEGFTISPGVSQREIMRELETILSTFQTGQEITSP